MCTVSFLPKEQGFYLAMNRDEKLDRFAGQLPTIVNLAGRRAIFPSEPDGGTWIAANDAGICLALINWHRVEREPKRDLISRGQVVRELAAKSSREEIAEALAELPLNRLRPFRLIAIIPLEKSVMEWRWDLERLSMRRHPWKLRHWFSSGFDESKAERERDRVCKAVRNKKSAGRLDWLRRLHRSHLPERGPFSICMHRSDAATVSYTEVAVSRERATMRYKPGTCCSNGAMVTGTISLAR
jgi:Transport and Golgi organisation 2